MKEILYVGYYDSTINAEQHRQYAPSAVNKMNYICSAINRAGWKVTIVSPCVTKGKKCCRGKVIDIREGTILKLFFSFGAHTKFERILRIAYMHIQLFIYLLLHTRRNEPVIVYHSLLYAKMIRWLKKIKGFRLILEVEEIYADVTNKKRDRKKEYKLFSCADSFLFPTELLDEVINTKNKPSTIIYGTYQVEENKYVDNRKDGIIHCVYAGTFDPRKGGVYAAINAATSLSDRYHIHILGFGSKRQEELVQEYILEVDKICNAKVSFDGVLEGEEYTRFIQSCCVGLSTQNPEASFNETSFPSKVLSYLANGLRVVSIRIKSLERSAVSDLLYYYDQDTPEAIAEAMNNIDFNKSYDSRTVIKKLDEAFVKDITILLAQ